MNYTRTMAAFLVTAAFALACLGFFVVTKYSEAMSIPNTTMSVIRGGVLLGLLSIVLLWCLYPSRVAVGLAGLFAALFPAPFYAHYLQGRAPQSVAEMTSDKGLLAATAFVTLLLVLATEIRRRMKVLPDRGGSS